MTVMKKVFMFIGLLVLIFLVWQIVFCDGGIVKTCYNALANAINTSFGKTTGKASDKILPLWDATHSANTLQGAQAANGF